MKKTARHDPKVTRWITSVTLLVIASTMAAGGEPSSEELARYDKLIKPAHRKHWSFQPVRKPLLPSVKDSRWVRNPIDTFVLTKLEKAGWKPAPAAEPRAFLRRLHLDLIGLPPTLAEQEAFLKDPSAAAVRRIIDDLLARPGYGERWGRHWLDLVRYAESNGYERDGAKPSVWRYRDYVTRAFNTDKPFDRFILEQLAGDELTEANAETLIATGYYRLGPWDDEPADPQQDRFDQLDDMVSTTAQVFLGLTLACARCHNHKFEPLTTQDYYRMVAVFNPLQRPQNGRTELDLPVLGRIEKRSLAERERRSSDLTQAAAANRRLALGYTVPAVVAGFIPGNAVTSGWLLAQSRTSIAGSRAAAQEIAQLQQAIAKLPRGYFLHEPSPKPPPTHILIRGSASRPGLPVEPGFPAVLVSKQPLFPAPGDHSSLRRLTLARWIASPDNPLTARVIVNRVWQFHFGEGLVRTSSDFGVMGEAPTHPQLLDWLADWFVKENWSLKKLHRLILASNTYHMSKRSNPEFSKKDPENTLLGHVSYHRLEVEAIRDSMLAVSGQLNPKMYGPSMYPEVPRQALEGHSDPNTIWKASDEREGARRTIYAFVKRSLIVPMIEVLDFCDTARTSAKRVVTTVAPQALTLFNGDFANRQAYHFARRLVREAGGDPQKQIDLAYRLALCRPPRQNERLALVEFLRRESASLIQESGRAKKPVTDSDTHLRALQQMCRVLFNANEFVYTD